MQVREQKLGYRPDLDGLRAVAVTSVLLCHLGSSLLPGGYVGVDVFFVLSGFLITRLIDSELRAGNFSIARFYERRIRRIVPALVVVSACCTVAALAILLPEELEQYAFSLLAAVFSASNIWFWTQSDYFSPAAASQPLLHTWSLGIEEQFYIIFPAAFAAIYKFRRDRLPQVIWWLLVISLGLSIAITHFHPKAAYFWIHTRAWELLLGGVIALGLVASPRTRWQCEISTALGLGGIVAAAMLFNAKTPFPGYAALLPCIGAGLIIWGGEGSRIADVLRNRPMVFIGLISYSLYLWHWPLIVFARLHVMRPFSPLEQTALAVAAVALSIPTWRFVETPFRKRGVSGFSTKSVFAAGGLGMGTLAVSALVLVALNGVPDRFSKDILAIAAAARDSSPMRDKCHFDGTLDGRYEKSCVFGAAVDPNTIVYGDSHGAELSFVLGSLAEARHESVRELTASGCPPAQDFAFPGRKDCATYNAQILQHLVSLSPKTIVVVAHSTGWMRRKPADFLPGLRKTLRALHGAGHAVILLGPVPTPPSEASIPPFLARNALLGKRPEDYLFDPGMSDLRKVDLSLAEMAQAENVGYVSLLPSLCVANGCRADINGIVLYFDNNHLSVAGAGLITAPLIAPLIWPKARIAGGAKGLAATETR